MSEQSRIGLIPKSSDAESGVLGAMLQDRTQIDEWITSNLPLDAFYDLARQKIAETMLRLHGDGKAVDLITLSTELGSRNELDQVGGISGLAQLIDGCPSPSNFPYWLEIMQEKFVMRNVLTACREIIGTVTEHEKLTDEMLDGIEKRMFGVGARGRETQTADSKKLVGQAIDWIEETHRLGGALRGLSSGFPDLDQLTDGFQNGDLIIIAARPSLGKSSLLMNIVENLATKHATPCGVFSLEMTGHSLMTRMLCGRARVNLRQVRRGELFDRDFPKLTKAAADLNKTNIYVDDESSLTIGQIRARARRMVQQHGAKLIGVDYIQLARSGEKRQTREEEVSDISNGLKAIAKELNVPVIALSQLNRAVEKDKRRRPSLSDMRSSGQIEQDADVVMMLFDPRSDDDKYLTDGPSDAIPITCFVAKQRNGPTGDVSLTFLKPYTRFESASRVDIQDAPERTPHND